MPAMEQSPVMPVPLSAERMHAICRRLPPFPPLATQLIAMFSRPDADLYGAVALIRSDAVFSGELLRIANSAEFASYEPFEDVSRAVLYLGFERVQSAIRRITYARLMREAFNHEFALQIHRNNLASALICENLISCFGFGDELEDLCPYSLGLYLKIGALVLLRAFPAHYPRFLCTRVSSQADLLATERTLFGFDHVAISRHLVEHWEFPESFQKMVSVHAQPLNGTAHMTMTAGAHFASQLAGALGFSFLKALPYPSFDELVAQLPDSGKSDFPRDPKAWKDRINLHLEEISLKH